MEQFLALEMVRVTEAAAIASARFMGRGMRDEADAAATAAMRATMDEADIAGTRSRGRTWSRRGRTARSRCSPPRSAAG